MSLLTPLVSGAAETKHTHVPKVLTPIAACSQTSCMEDVCSHSAWGYFTSHLSSSFLSPSQEVQESSKGFHVHQTPICLMVVSLGKRKHWFLEEPNTVEKFQ